MIQQDIRMAIDDYYEKIDSASKNGLFILNDKIIAYNEEIDKLREVCLHEFEEGICKWCDMPEEYCK